MEREEKVDRELAAAAIAGGCDGGWGGSYQWRSEDMGDLISFRFKGSRMMWMSFSLPLGRYLSVSFLINFFPSHSLKEKKKLFTFRKIYEYILK